MGKGRAINRGPTKCKKINGEEGLIALFLVVIMTHVLLQEIMEHPAAARMIQLAKRTKFDLTDRFMTQP